MEAEQFEYVNKYYITPVRPYFVSWKFVLRDMTHELDKNMNKK